MAQDTDIGIRIKLNGVTQAVTSIKDLETAILAAKEQLKTLDVGSAAFQKLSTEISTADTKLQNLKKTSQGVKFEKQLSDFVKFGSAITSGFAAATAAVNLFGGDTEKVSEAAAKAQNLLTVALGARSVAEGIVSIRTVKTTIATIAQTAATNASSVAMKAFFTLIATNPLGALFTVIGLVVGALILFGDETKKAKDAEEAFQKTLKNSNDQQERKIRLLKAGGATAKEVAEDELRTAENNFRMAQYYLLNTFKNDENYEKRKAEFEEADIVRKEKRKVRDDIVIKETEESENTLSENRKKRTDAENARREKELQALLEQIRITEELNRAELVRISTGQRFIDLGVVFELEKQNIEFLRLKDVLGDTSSLLEKYGATFKKNIKRDQLVLEGYTTDWSAAKEKLSTGIVEGLITPAVFKQIESDRKKYETNLRLINQALVGAKTDILKTDLSRIVQEQMDMQQGTGKTFEELQKSTFEYQALQDKFVQSFVKANLNRNQSNKAVAAQEKELTLTGQEYFKILVQNQTQSLLYENAVGKLKEQFDLATVANENYRKSGVAANGFIRENIDLITESLNLDLQSLTMNQEGILNLEKAILGERKNQYFLYAEDIKLIEKELAKSGIDIITASEEEKMRILYEYIKKRQQATTGDLDDFIGKLEKNIEAFRNMFQSIGQGFALQIGFELDDAEARLQIALKDIEKDAETSQAKRLEAEKIYQGEIAAIQKRQAKINLQLTLTQAIADAAAAIINITKQTGVFATIAATIAAASSAAQIGIIAAQINKIDSYQTGGYIKAQGGLVVGPSHEYGGVKYAQGGVELEGGEAVINRVSSVKYSGLLSEINQAGGGKPMVVNNFDDSRIVEALAKQRKEPLRAYVVEQDITTAQQVNRRLQSLSQI